MRYEIVASTDIGLRKLVNQDRYLAKTAHTDLGNICMALICDGMGGLEEGEKASETVARVFDKWFADIFRNTINKSIDKEAMDSVIEKLLYEANNILIEYGREKNINLGTTASIIIFIENNYFTYHIGDTRIYKYDDKLVQLTQDHTLIALRVKNGQLTKEEAKISPEKNLLLQCVGVSNLLEIHKTQGECTRGDAFLLGSDGLYNKLEDFEILNTLKNIKNEDRDSMQERIDYLINVVKSRGETDNISGMLIKLD